MSGAHSGRVWRQVDTAKPLRAWRSEQLEQLVAAVGDAVIAWERAWGLGAHAQSGVVWACSADGQDPDGAWQCLDACSGVRAWIALPDGFGDRLAHRLWQAEAASGPIANSVLDACHEDLLGRVCSLIGASRVSDGIECPRLRLGAWSGSVLVTVPSGPRLLFEAAAVARLLRSAQQERSHDTAAGRALPPIMGVTQALRSRRLVTRVLLAGCDLQLGALQDLRPGDVVRLQHRLDTPVTVTDASDRPLFAGFLARSRGRRAIQLSPLQGQ